MAFIKNNVPSYHYTTLFDVMAFRCLHIMPYNVGRFACSSAGCPHLITLFTRRAARITFYLCAILAPREFVVIEFFFVFFGDDDDATRW